MHPFRVVAATAVVLSAACSSSSPELRCGPDTHEVNGTCIPSTLLSCGTGTHAEAVLCVRDAPPVTCGPGTHATNGACVPDGTLTCGPGTHESESQCVLDAVPLACGGGTHAEGLVCVPDVACGPGTHAAGGQCVPDSSLTCGTGTHAVDGTCVPDPDPITCGPGTHLSGGACVPDSTLTCGPGTHADGGLCVLDALPLTCGAGTHVDGTRCLPDVTCGPGTHVDGALCVPESTLTCGPGTHVDGGACVPDAAPITCGAGTHLSNGSCIPDSTLSCGPGTHADGAQCVLDPPLTCGPGTRADGMVCVSLGGYWDLRVESTELLANGYFKYRVLAIGRRDDGTPATDDVLVLSERPEAGTFEPAAFTLGAVGSETWFTPCSTVSPGCTGPTRFHLVLASDPAVVLASSPPLDVVAPVPSADPSPCLVGGNVIYIDSQLSNWGIKTVRTGTWKAWYPEPAHVWIYVTGATNAEGYNWSLRFSTLKLEQILQTQVYDDAFGEGFEPWGHPGMEVTGYGTGCNDVWGRFQVHEIAFTGVELERFTASFEHYCDPYWWTKLTTGCVHYERGVTP